MKKSESETNKAMWLPVSIAAFILIFSYLSLNLKNIDFGYEMQELTEKETALKEQINKLKAEKASLLNLERVEDIVINKLNYQYPESDQFIKVFEEDESGEESKKQQ
jgi:cell division protein FtsL